MPWGARQEPPGAARPAFQLRAANGGASSNEIQCTHLNLGVWKPGQISVQAWTRLTVLFLNLFVLSFGQETICWRDNFAVYM